MSEPADPGGGLGYEAFGTACGLSVVSGALSLLVPGLTILTATLVALAVAGWASLRGRDGRGPPERRREIERYAPPLAVLAAAAVLFLEPPAPAEPWRALLLGLGVVPLWMAERRGPGRRSSP